MQSPVQQARQQLQTWKSSAVRFSRQMRHMGCVPLALRLMVALSERPKLPLLRRPNRLKRCAVALRMSGLLPAGLTRPLSAEPCTATASHYSPSGLQRSCDTANISRAGDTCGLILLQEHLSLVLLERLATHCPTVPLLRLNMTKRSDSSIEKGH